MTNRATAVLTGPAFLLVAAFLSLVERDTLDTWAWTPLDHHGVPWPSALTLTSLGWLQAAAFAVTGVALLALAGRLRPLRPAWRSAAVAVGGLRLAGAGLACAALPLDHPVGDPAELASWVGSWHAVAHMAGFVAAAVGGIAAVAALALATRRSSPRLARVSGAVAAVSVVSLALPGALGWYAFLAAFFSWTAMLAGILRERAPVTAAA
jgi:hypothetical protein